MADYLIFDGGTRNSSGGFYQYPSVNTAGVPPMGYADHQLSKRYTVSKHIDLRPIQNWGINSTKDVALPYYMMQNSITFAAGDTIETHLLLPKSVLTAVSYEVYADGLLTGGTFRLYRNSVGSGTTYFTGISTAAAGYGFTSTAGSMPVLLTAQDYITLEFTAVPAGNITWNCGLHMRVDAQVLLLDNGNA